jgi:hypothetical protein
MAIFAKCHCLQTTRISLFSKTSQMLQIVTFIIWPSFIFFTYFFNMDVNCRSHEHNAYIFIIRSPFGGEFFSFCFIFSHVLFCSYFHMLFLWSLNYLHMYNIVNIIVLSSSSFSTCLNILDHIKLCKLNVIMILQILNFNVKLITFLPS